MIVRLEPILIVQDKSVRVAPKSTKSSWIIGAPRPWHDSAFVRFAWKGASRASSTSVEGNGNSPPEVVGCPRKSPGARALRELQRRQPESLGLCTDSSEARRRREPAMPITSEEAGFSACSSTFVRHDGPSSNAGHPEGLALARTQQHTNDRGLHQGRSERKAGSDQRNHSSKGSQGPLPPSGRAHRQTEGPIFMGSGSNFESVEKGIIIGLLPIKICFP